MSDLKGAQGLEGAFESYLREKMEKAWLLLTIGVDQGMILVN